VEDKKARLSGTFGIYRYIVPCIYLSSTLLSEEKLFIFYSVLSIHVPSVADQDPFYTDSDPAFHFDTDLAFQFDMDPDPTV
jgi:hypothetical protein